MWKFTQHVFPCCNIDFYPTFVCINVSIYHRMQLLNSFSALTAFKLHVLAPLTLPTPPVCHCAPSLSRFWLSCCRFFSVFCVFHLPDLNFSSTSQAWFTAPFSPACSVPLRPVPDLRSVTGSVVTHIDSHCHMSFRLMCTVKIFLICALLARVASP